MKVKELIQQLQKVNPNAEVVIHGYEDGYDPIHRIKELVIHEYKQEEYFAGKYNEVEYFVDKEFFKPTPINAVLID